MFSDVRRYGFINAKLKARISKLLSPEFMRRLSLSPTLTEAMILLKDTEYAAAERAYSVTGDLKMAELSFLEAEIGVVRNVRKFAEGPLQDFTKGLLLRYDIEVFRQTFRLWFDRVVRGRDISAQSGYLPREQVSDAFPLDDILSAPDLDRLVDLLPPGIYRDAVSDNREAVEAGKSVFPVEIALDLRFFRNLELASGGLGQTDRDIVARMIGVEIDMENITRIMRFHYFFHFPPEEIARYLVPGGFRIGKEQLKGAAFSPDEAFSTIAASGYGALSTLGTVPGETSSPFSRMELIGSLLDEILRAEISRLLGGNPFTVGILLSYFILKRQEIRRLSAILNGIGYNLPEDRMRRLAQ